MDQATEEICKRAINHVLCQIRDREDVQYLLGCGTQSYGLLTEAAAALDGEPVDQVRNNLIPGSGEIHGRRRAA